MEGHSLLFPANQGLAISSLCRTAYPNPLDSSNGTYLQFNCSPISILPPCSRHKHLKLQWWKMAFELIFLLLLLHPTEVITQVQPKSSIFSLLKSFKGPPKNTWFSACFISHHSPPRLSSHGTLLLWNVLTRSLPGTKWGKATWALQVSGQSSSGKNSPKSLEWKTLRSIRRSVPNVLGGWVWTWRLKLK